jgi:hypothetical protein
MRRRIGIQAARRLTDHRIAQNVGKLAREFPGIEKRHPIDIRQQFLERIVIEGPDSQESSAPAAYSRPIDFEFLGARLRQRQLRRLGALVAMLLAAHFMLGLDVRHVGVARAGVTSCWHTPTERATRPSHRSPRPRTAGRFSRPCAPGGGRAADQQRLLVAQALHLLGHVHHLIQRGRDQPGQSDEIRALARRRLEDFLAGGPSRPNPRPRSYYTAGPRRRCSCRCRAHRP